MDKESEIDVFGEEAVCSSFEAVHKDHLEGGSIFKPENITVFSSTISRFLKDRRNVCFLGCAPRQVHACLLLGFLCLTLTSLPCLIWS